MSVLQVITGSHDTTIRMWDLRKGTTMCTLTQHKKSVRALVAHPTEHALASAGADNIKKFKLPNVSHRLLDTLFLLACLWYLCIIFLSAGSAASLLQDAGTNLQSCCCCCLCAG